MPLYSEHSVRSMTGMRLLFEESRVLGQRVSSKMRYVQRFKVRVIRVLIKVKSMMLGMVG